MALIDSLLNLLFPPKCPFCHRLLGKEETCFCASCQKSLPWSAGPLGVQDLEFLSGCVSPLFYRENVQNAVRRFKFSNRPGYSSTFGLLMTQAARDTWPDVPFDAVVWVPLSKRRKRKRGYDQAELLAKEVGKGLNLPVLGPLVKHRHTPAQSLQAQDSARKANVLGAYRMTGQADVTGKVLLLCDDVVTTGSTLSECARILRTAGCAQVYAVTLARARK